MLLSSQADFKYDDQNPPSNPPGLPSTRDSSSGRGDRYRNILSETFGFGGARSSSDSPSDSRGSSRNDDKKRYPNSRLFTTRGRNERSHLDAKSPSVHLSREDLRDFALGTLRTLDEGEYFPPGAIEPYDLKMKIMWTDDNTRYYGPEAGEGGEMLESEFIRINEEGGDEGKKEEEQSDGDVKMDAGEENKNVDDTKEGEDKLESTTTESQAENKQIDDNSNPEVQAQVQATAPPDNSATVDTPIYIGEYSTLVGARRLHLALASNPDPPTNKKIGILNFASAKKPGGGFINGSQAQEESIARSSTLFPSLTTDAASQFYTHYHEDPSNGYYTHAMVYSPRIVLLRDDSGEWRSPVEVDVLTSAAVNAGEIRRQLEREERQRREREEMEIWKRKGEERRKELEKAMAEKERVKKVKERVKMEKEKVKVEKGRVKKEKEIMAKLKKERAKLVKQKRVVQSGDGSETKGTERGQEKDSGSEEESTSIDQEKEDKEEEEKGDGDEAEAEAEENQEEKPTDSPGSGSSFDGEMKKEEENPESKGVSTQDDQPQPEVPSEVNQELTSSSTDSHPLSPQTQPSQAPKPDPDLTYALALSDAESQIQYIMYTRISRILHLFQLHQTPHLILGSFGTGVFQNRIDVVASIFADLLVKPGGRFKNVFKMVVFAILGKETVRIFENVFSTVEKQAQREIGGTSGTCLFSDENGSDEDVREDEEQRMMRMTKWEARRTALADAAQAEADAASLTAASLTADQASTAAYTAAQVEVDAISFAAAQVDTAHAEAASTIQTNPEDDDLTTKRTTTPTTPKAMIVDDGKDIEMVDIKSLSGSCNEAQNSKLNEKEESDVEMQ